MALEQLLHTAARGLRESNEILNILQKEIIIFTKSKINLAKKRKHQHLLKSNNLDFEIRKYWKIL
jgi:hypothetical protein